MEISGNMLFLADYLQEFTKIQNNYVSSLQKLNKKFESQPCFGDDQSLFLRIHICDIISASEKLCADLKIEIDNSRCIVTPIYDQLLKLNKIYDDQKKQKKSCVTASPVSSADIKSNEQENMEVIVKTIVALQDSTREFFHRYFQSMVMTADSERMCPDIGTLTLKLLHPTNY